MEISVCQPEDGIDCNAGRKPESTYWILAEKEQMARGMMLLVIPHPNVLSPVEPERRRDLRKSAIRTALG
jgi:hypothetical protein